MLEFGAYVILPGSKEQIWLPHTATDPDVIDQVRKMEAGELFYITKSTGLGGVGVMVEEVDRPCPKRVYEIPSGKNIVSLSLDI